MNFLPRQYQDLSTHLQKGKVLVLYGPRRVGKTTLLNGLLKQTPHKYRLESGENLRLHEQLSHQNFSDILEFAEGYELIAIDEAQAVPNIGMALKILVDQRPDLRIIVTGSSSFELANQIGEPLTGRKRTLMVYPLAQMELLQVKNRSELADDLPARLIYGAYPAVVAASSDRARRELVLEITDSYLLKDILAHEQIKNSKVMRDLLRLLALQVGSLVSLSELGGQLGLHVKTVERYLDLLEKSFVIWRLDGLSRNLRSEIRRQSKYYFYDTGVRNALLGAFQPLEQRADIGALWENFALMERKKYRAYHTVHGNEYFWRTYAKAEIDLIEERDGHLHAFECKWQPKHVKAPAAWQQHYPDADFSVITRENLWDFVS